MKIARKLLGTSVRWIAGLPLPNRYYCCACHSRIARFLPYTPAGLRPFRQPAFLAAMETVGSDVDNFSCPRCGAHDRERHLVLYLDATGLSARLSGANVLHLAPEAHLSSFIQRRNPARYVQGDLYPSAPGVERVDLQAMEFPDSSFDFLIANHVMEHVTEDLVALREIRRVLREGGYAILQTPYSQVLTGKFEDPGITSATARLHAYGQEDHVRLYGRDIFERFAGEGMVDRTVCHRDVLDQVDARVFGVNPLEPLFLFQKPDAADTALPSA